MWASGKIAGFIDMNNLEIARDETRTVVERIERLLAAEMLSESGWCGVLTALVLRVARMGDDRPLLCLVCYQVAEILGSKLRSEVDISHANSFAHKITKNQPVRMSERIAAHILFASLPISEISYRERVDNFRAASYSAARLSRVVYGQGACLSERRQQLADIIAALEAQSANAS